MLAELARGGTWISACSCDDEANWDSLAREAKQLLADLHFDSRWLIERRETQMRTVVLRSNKKKRLFHFARTLLCGTRSDVAINVILNHKKASSRCETATED